MHKPSFLTGLFAGSAVAIVAVVSVPGIVPAREEGNHGRAPAPRVLVVPAEPVAAASPAPAPPGDSPTPELPPAEKPAPKQPEMDLAAARRASNESAALATLRNIVSAQAQFQAAARADENRNGVGEYGSFAELSGSIGVRDGRLLNPPVLSSAFRKPEKGYVERNGYRFRMFLPQAGGQPVSERDGGGFGAGETDAALAETLWCCYAWPVEGDGPTFFVNQSGDILQSEAGYYKGDREPPAYAAFENASGLAAPLAIADRGSRGADRCEWKQAG
jgi:hypothetical protein